MTYEADDLGRIGKVIPEPHHMEYYDRNSLNEIKKLIDKNRYDRREQIEEHLQFLERLADKLKSTLDQEQSYGETAWMLKKDVEDVRKTFAALSTLLDKY
ncbi:TPA: hypothetical protein HA246_04915 [Candidatus Woesearchaeota archaeon]|nr:hypothetical protein [Candidatus Woesearchaeota archaeon]